MVWPSPEGGGGASPASCEGLSRHVRSSIAVSSLLAAGGVCGAAGWCSSLIVSGTGSAKLAPRWRSRSTIPGGYEIDRTCPQFRQCTSEPGRGYGLCRRRGVPQWGQEILRAIGRLWGLKPLHLAGHHNTRHPFFVGWDDVEGSAVGYSEDVSHRYSSHSGLESQESPCSSA
jgi:hypothetical protein